MFVLPQGPALIASPYGGVNIEDIAKTSPSYIFKDPVDITSGVSMWLAWLCTITCMYMYMYMYMYIGTTIRE